MSVQAHFTKCIFVSIVASVCMHARWSVYLTVFGYVRDLYKNVLAVLSFDLHLTILTLHMNCMKAADIVMFIILPFQLCKNKFMKIMLLIC
jgi:hypothetical protein